MVKLFKSSFALCNSSNFSFCLQGSSTSKAPNLCNSSYEGQIAEFFGLPDMLSVNISLKSLRSMKLGNFLLKVNESVVLCPIGGATPAQFGLVVKILEQTKGKLALVCKMYRT